MNLKEILKKFAEEMGETITEEWEVHPDNHTARTDEYSYDARNTDEGVIIDTFDGQLSDQEINNATPGTSYLYTGENFEELH